MLCISSLPVHNSTERCCIKESHGKFQYISKHAVVKNSCSPDHRDSTDYCIYQNNNCWKYKYQLIITSIVFLGNRFDFVCFVVNWAWFEVQMQSDLIIKVIDVNCHASEWQTMLNSMTKHTKSKCISILTCFSLKNEKKMLQHFYSAHHSLNWTINLHQ